VEITILTEDNEIYLYKNVKNNIQLNDTLNELLYILEFDNYLDVIEDKKVYVITTDKVSEVKVNNETFISKNLNHEFEIIRYYIEIEGKIMPTKINEMSWLLRYGKEEDIIKNKLYIASIIDYLKNN
jgi:hypothetical protein